MKEKQPTYWQAIGIGVLAGFVLSIIEDMLNPYSGWNPLLAIIAILSGMIGASIGKKWKKSLNAIWTGAILGASLAADFSLFSLIVFFLLVIKATKHDERLTSRLAIKMGIALGCATLFVGAFAVQAISSLQRFLPDYSSWIISSIVGCIVFAPPYGVAGALFGRNQTNSFRGVMAGAITGAIMGAGIFGLLLSLASFFRNQGLEEIYLIILFTLPGIPFGIIGALTGKNWKGTQRAKWIGGVVGVTIGVVLFGWLYAWASFGFAVA